MADNDLELATVFKALGDQNRLRILRLLRNGEKCACDLLEGMEISQSTLSHHMATLCESGIVSGRQDGKWTFYSIDHKASATARTALTKILSRSTNRETKRSPACA
jgi:ArsR family transcriptional regulator, arsenate/arsenite/antimonite-responsive transcriptional repressor